MNDLTGNADERMRQLTDEVERGAVTNEWLQRQLALALAAWAESQTAVDQNIEARADF